MTPHSEQWTFKSQNSEVYGVLPQIAFLDSNKTRHLPKRPFQHFTKYCFFLRGFCFFALVSTSFTTLRSLCFFETSRLVRFNPTLFAFPEQRCQNIKGMYFPAAAGAKQHRKTFPWFLPGGGEQQRKT